MRRRTALKLLLGSALAPRWIGASPVFADLPATVIGFSQGGLPLVVHHVGGGSSRLLVLGGQHGGPEANTTELANALLSHFWQAPGEIPTGLGLDFLVVANPDGAAVGSRQYLSGVDPNRNWAGPDWQSDAWDSNAVFRPGLGGPEPFSEQESRALRDWILASRPVLLVNYHSAGGFMFGGQAGLAADLAAAYAEASGYYRPQPSSGGGPRLLGYRATGSTNVWLRDQNLAGLFIELTTSTTPELGRNLAGLRAVLARLAPSDGSAPASRAGHVA